ncbi:MAG: aminotransferase class III-fold pyridoxal phosphate-dependent enzyme, partial [Thaumarchaeota archaeon]|nr:aminotransferase class III-fold pyridoxal phosphate-dependent enzyme [Nitrososphaerota archaeon]
EEYLEKFVPVDEVAAYFFEPCQGEGGYIIPPPDHFRRMGFLRKEGVLFVDDEIQTGMGRTGKFFAVEHFGVAPDIISIAKGIASGLPLGAIIAKAEIMRSWKPGQHASTFGANPVAVAAALATLEVMKSEKLVQNAKKMGEMAMKGLAEMKGKHALIGDVRGLGLFIGVEVVKDRRTKERGEEEALRIVNECFENGLIAIIAGKNTIRIIPPLNVSEEELEEGLDIFEMAVAKVSNSE